MYNALPHRRIRKKVCMRISAVAVAPGYNGNCVRERPSCRCTVHLKGKSRKKKKSKKHVEKRKENLTGANYRCSIGNRLIENVSDLGCVCMCVRVYKFVLF